MSNLKNRLKKTAGGSEISTKIYEIFNEEMSKKLKEANWPEDEIDGCMDIAEANMREISGYGVDKFADAMASACEEWLKDTTENYPNGPEN